MKKQAFQKATIRDSEGNIIQTGAYDVETDPLLTGTHDGTLNYMVNNLEALHDDINKNKLNGDSSLSNEISARKSADSTLQSNIDAEASALKSADSTLQSNIDAEASARKSADSTLQSRTAIHLAYVDGDLALVEE